MNKTIGVAGCIGYLFMIVCAVFFSGGVLSVLWGWFIVPLGMQPIAIAHALGLGITIRAVTNEYPLTKEQYDKASTGEMITTMFGREFWLLILGFLFHSFM